VCYAFSGGRGTLKKLSSDDKYKGKRGDPSLQRLIDLDGEIMEVGGGYWVSLRPRKVPPSVAKPHGIDYSLSLLGPDGRRLVGYDNAHPVAVGSGPARKRRTSGDHRHARTTVRPYDYSDAETLLQDFWADVERVLKEEGIS
jgi:hypothetical protein